MADSQAGSFVIRELTGRKRTLRLTGRALPYRGVAFPGTMRVEVTWYPGNPEGSGQVLGPTTDPTSCKGYWKDRFLKSFAPDGTLVQPSGAAELDGSPLADAMSILLAVESLRDQGQQVEVTWDQIIRRGWLTKFTPTVHLVTDIEWDMEFTWISKGDSPAPAVFINPTDLTDLRAGWVTRKAALVAAAKPTTATDSNFLEGLQSLVGKLTDGVGEIEAAVSRGVDTALTQVDTVRRLVGVLTYIATSANELINNVEDRVATSLLQAQNVYTAGQAQVTAIAGNLSGTDFPFGQSVAAGAYQRGLLREARGMRGDAARQRADLAKQVDSDLLAVYTARAGQDLRDVSTIYYQTPHEWRRLQRFNGLDTSALVAGQVVFVPKLQQAGA